MVRNYIIDINNIYNKYYLILITNRIEDSCQFVHVPVTIIRSAQEIASVNPPYIPS